MKPPKLVLVSAHAARTIAALGADAVAHSTSTAASPSSPLTPGSSQAPPFKGFLDGCGWICVSVPCGNFFDRPKVLRNACQSSVVYRFVSSTTTTVWPCPENPFAYRGLML